MAFGIRTLRLTRADVLPYNSGPNRSKHAHTKQIRRSISNERQALSWMTLPRYKNCFVCVHLWPAASMTTGGARDVWLGFRSNIVSVFLSDTVRPAASKTSTMTVISLAIPSADLEKIPASSASKMPHTALLRQASGPRFRPIHPPRDGPNPLRFICPR